MVEVFKRRDFARWQAKERLSDAALCEAVREMAAGLIDADLGGHLFKKRVARLGGGKRSGYRTLVSARLGRRYVFLHGFGKSEKSDVTPDERQGLRHAGQVLLALPAPALEIALMRGLLLGVQCEEQDH